MSIKKVNEIKKQIEELEDRIFYLQMKDRWDSEDFKDMRDMELELQILKEKLIKSEGENKNEDNNK